MVAEKEPQPMSGSSNAGQGGLTSRNASNTDPKAHEVLTRLFTVVFTVDNLHRSTIKGDNPQKIRSNYQNRGTSKEEGRGGGPSEGQNVDTRLCGCNHSS